MPQSSFELIVSRFLKICFIVTAVILSQCKQDKVTGKIPNDSILGLWKIVSVDNAEMDPAMNELQKFNFNRFLQLNSDHSYTSNITGQYDFGQFDDKERTKGSIVFRSHSGDVYSRRFLYSNDGKGVLYDEITLPGGNKKVEVINNCIVRKYQYSDVKMDPFSTLNNLWRLPAKETENDSLLALRIANHIDFWKSYLHTADEMEWSTLDMTNVETCFNFSSYGIQLMKAEKWLPAFRSIFFSRKEAERAYDLVTDAIYKSQFVKDENAYRQGIGLFSQIQYYLLHPKEAK